MAGCSWSTEPMRAVLGRLISPPPGCELAEDQLEQGRLADAVAADQPDLGARRQADGGVVEEAAAPGVEGQVVDLEHGEGEISVALQHASAARRAVGTRLETAEGAL